jgi:two-component sensor histidine kinase
VNGERQFSFQWQESGGPSVRQPVRTGFGSAILLDAAKQQFGEQIVLQYDPGGLRYELRVALSAIEVQKARVPKPSEDDPAVA